MSLVWDILYAVSIGWFLGDVIKWAARRRTPQPFAPHCSRCAQFNKYALWTHYAMRAGAWSARRVPFIGRALHKFTFATLAGLWFAVILKEGNKEYARRNSKGTRVPEVRKTDFSGRENVPRVQPEPGRL